MSNSFLKEIIEYKRGVIEVKKAFYASLKDEVRPCTQTNRFKFAISKPGTINLIAEIKKASPSKGLIRDHFNPVEIAKIYHDHHAAAISVLTEDKYFSGKPEFIRQITEKIDLPVLTKDFIIDEGQIFEARANKASAVLLIVAILDDKTIKTLIDVATNLGLDCLVEVHNEEELKRACAVGAEVIGVNNRDLNTFDVDINTCVDLVPKIPNDKIIVAESGLSSHKEIAQLSDLGAHAVLIGETFMKEEDIGAKIDEVMHG